MKVKTIKVQTLRSDFQNIKKIDSGNLKDYSFKTMELFNQMKINGETIMATQSC